MAGTPTTVQSGSSRRGEGGRGAECRGLPATPTRRRTPERLEWRHRAQQPRTALLPPMVSCLPTPLVGVTQATDLLRQFFQVPSEISHGSAADPAACRNFSTGWRAPRARPNGNFCVPPPPIPNPPPPNRSFSGSSSHPGRPSPLGSRGSRRRPRTPPRDAGAHPAPGDRPEPRIPLRSSSPLPPFRGGTFPTGEPRSCPAPAGMSGRPRPPLAPAARPHSLVPSS